MSFTARDGQITGLFGPNGAGKSTTLRMLYTVLKPDAGDAFIDGMSVTADPLAARRAIGVLSHGAGVYNHLTARENIAYFGELHGLSRAEREARAAELIELLEMQPFADRLAKGFSQGQKLKTALARALVHRPRNVLLDEPTNGLDVMAVRGLRKLLAQLRDAGHCVLFSSHVMQEVEQLCDEVVVIAGGQVVAAGALAEIRARAGNSQLEDAFVQPHERRRRRRRQVNLRGIWAVFRKEFRENLRDRRTLLSALVFGPVLGPVLVAGLVQFSISRAETQSDENITVAVTHAERAPNLLAYLTRARRRHREGGSRRGRGARRGGHADAQDHPRDSRGFRRAPAGRPAGAGGAVLGQLARLRAPRRRPRARAGLATTASRSRSCASWRAASIRSRCCRSPCRRSTCRRPASRSVLVLNMMTYLVLLSMLFGGLYLAIDATAGERERGSLEVLLTSPVPREHLIYGKILAAAAYMLISLVLTVTMFAVAMSFVGLEQLGITANLGPAAAAQMMACCAPLILFGAAYLTIISAFAKSYREAQTYLRLVITIPTHAADVRRHARAAGRRLALMFVPFLSQHLLMTTVVRAEQIEPLHVLVSVGEHAGLRRGAHVRRRPAVPPRRPAGLSAQADFLPDRVHARRQRRRAVLREQRAVAEDLRRR